LFFPADRNASMGKIFTTDTSMPSTFEEEAISG
jgi:hypothetical protein